MITYDISGTIETPQRAQFNPQDQTQNEHEGPLQPSICADSSFDAMAYISHLRQYAAFKGMFTEKEIRVSYLFTFTQNKLHLSIIHW